GVVAEYALQLVGDVVEPTAVRTWGRGRHRHRPGETAVPGRVAAAANAEHALAYVDHLELGGVARRRQGVLGEVVMRLGRLVVGMRRGADLGVIATLALVGVGLDPLVAGDLLRRSPLRAPGAVVVAAHRSSPFIWEVGRAFIRSLSCSWISASRCAPSLL